ncbi:hypothetical protein OG879_10820 [Streptomyces caniferus]|nr:DUF6801 domain-containing protein [Streptomyces caniferus]
MKYTCKVPVIKNQPLMVKIDADIPESVRVHEASRKFAIGARTTVDADLTAKLRLFGVRTVEGTVAAKVGVSAPQGDRRISVPLGITKTGIPASGSFTVAATGAAPALTFSRPGTARITVGDISLHVVGKKAGGGVLGQADVRCRLNAGQKNVVGSFEITGKGKATRSATSGTSGPSGTSATSGTSGTNAKGATASGVTPERTSSAAHGAATGGTATTGQDTRDLVLPIVGALVAGAVAFWIGSWRRSRRRAADSR